MSLSSFHRRELLTGLAAGAAVAATGLPAIAAPSPVEPPNLEWRRILSSHLVLANVERTMVEDGQHKSLIDPIMELNRDLIYRSDTIIAHRCLIGPEHLTPNGYRITARTRKLRMRLNLSTGDDTLLAHPDVWPEVRAMLVQDIEHDFRREQKSLEIGGFVMAHYLPVLARIEVAPETFEPSLAFRTSYGIVPLALADLPRHMVGV